MKRPTKDEPSWRVFIVRKKATLLGYVSANDEAEALTKAVKELGVRKIDQWRLIAQRE